MAIGNCSVAQKQLIELAKVISNNIKVLIMDEPTSALNDVETEHLFQFIHRAAAQGVSIFYISHKLEELFEVADRVVVIRDGCVTGEIDMAVATKQLLISRMVGRDLKDMYERDLSDEGKARLENVQEFLGAVAEYEKAADNPSLEDYLENIALVTDLDNADLKSSNVTLMTIHSAKGLEFPIVFMVGLEEGIFPNGRSLHDDTRLEEERRLCYVAITRAREMLFISYAAQRMLYNQVNYNAPSRFLKEIPERLLDDQWISQREKSFPGVMDSYSHPAPKRAPRHAMSHTMGSGLGAGRSALGVPGVQKGFTPSAAASVPKDAVPAIFEVGDRVMHRKFGEGNVLEIRGSGSDARIVISFTAYGSKEFALSIAPIVKVVD